MASTFVRIIRHEAVTLGCAIALIVGSLWEVGDTLLTDIASLELSTGHGVLLFGIVHALRSSQELVEARDKKAAAK
ncbi:MAG: hypothetical protein GVY28_13995 [Alphaproteobacteria bacterium]|jgi:predicted outer membrane lipoprotein|nr:hypothetical protein [Alphaproteobacteria bacterium]